MQGVIKKFPVAVAMALAVGSAVAATGAGNDTEGFHGYARVGAGTSSTHGPQSCFGLGGNTMKYRLGNECDAYLEGGYTHDFTKVDGVTYTGTVWVNAYSPNSDFGDAKLGVVKAYVEAKGIEGLNGGTAWIGKRFYVRPDIHMLDLQYINLNGTGAGVDQVKMGPGHFSYAFFKDNDANIIDPTTGKVTNTSAATRQNFIYQDIPVNVNGTIDLVATIITAQGEADRHNGWQLSAFHRQDKVTGNGGNTFGVQYGVGPGTGVGGDRIGASGSTLLGTDVTRARVFDNLWIQPLENFGMEFIALQQRDKSNAGGTSTWTTIGARPVYALSKNIKLALELGTDRVTQPNGPALRLTKITFAPSISAGPGLWARPELRAFVTYGRWNDAARDAVNANNNSGPVYGSNNNGTSYGFQVETWF